MQSSHTRRWVPGVGVILIGCFFLIAGIVARLGGSPFTLELADGLLIAVICFLTGTAMLLRRPVSRAESAVEDSVIRPEND